MDFKTLFHLKADSPQNLLKKLYEHSKYEADKEKPLLPQLILLLNGGNMISGFLLHYNLSNGEILIGQSHEGMSTLKYCNSASVISLELQNTFPFMYMLSDGKIPFQPAEADIPTNLEIKRSLSDTGIKLSEKIGKDIIVQFDLSNIKSSMELYTSKLLIHTIKQSLSKIADNELGKEALGKFESVELQLGEDKLVEVSNNKLKISCEVVNRPALAWSVTELCDKIEEKL